MIIYCCTILLTSCTDDQNKMAGHCWLYLIDIKVTSGVVTIAQGKVGGGTRSIQGLEEMLEH